MGFDFDEASIDHPHLMHPGRGQADGHWSVIRPLIKYADTVVGQAKYYCVRSMLDAFVALPVVSS